MMYKEVSEEWREWLSQMYYGENCKIFEDNSVEIIGDFFINDMGLKEIPFKLRKVTGIIDISDNKLTSFDGCPDRCPRDLYCCGNQITNFDSLPKTICSSLYTDVIDVKMVDIIFESSSHGVQYWNGEKYELLQHKQLLAKLAEQGKEIPSKYYVDLI